MCRRGSGRCIALLLLMFFATPVVTFAFSNPTSKLPPRFKEWLTKDVLYIITNEEREAFFHLQTDDERDAFIDRFWEVRNPTPGSPDNPYKAEHYKRLAYATQYFGLTTHTDGWRTDQGKVYIELGEPQQRQKLYGLQKLTPMEVWFYQNASPALPPYFYVVFFQRDAASEFKLYSPYQDGPEKLINAAVGPSRQDALKIINDSAGSEVAKVSLSLLTDEPVDMTGQSVSMASDVMLNTIRNFANNPLVKEELAHRRQLLEDVTHRVILPGDYLDAVTVPLRDAHGETNLHYLVRLRRPEDFTIGQTSNGYYYNVEVLAILMDATGKEIYRDEKEVSRNVSPDEMQGMKDRNVGFESWLPIAPGKYKLEVQFTNKLRKTTFRVSRDVVVPDERASALQVSNLVPFDKAEEVPQGAQALVPFSSAGVQFVPMAGNELNVIQGKPLQFFYQVWASQQQKKGTGELEVEYVYGRMGSGTPPSTLRDVIPLTQLDHYGSIVNGKRLPTTELEPGNYRLVMTLRDPASQAKVFSNLVFRVTSAGEHHESWDITDPTAVDNVRSGLTDYRRSLCYLSAKMKDQALRSLEAAHQHAPEKPVYSQRLIEAYFADQQYAQVTALYARGALPQDADEQSVLRVASSFEKTGNVKKALEIMEAASRQKPSSGPLLLGLAEYYRKTGDSARADEVERKGRALMATAPAS
jgi:GWxTD domain-containing protein